MRLVLASANPDKAREIEGVLYGLGFELLPRPAGLPDVEETGTTRLENARLKAEAVQAATGMAAVADDTGLEVDALGGAPGVYTARFAGPEATYADNVAKMLRELDGRDDRGARFRAIAYVSFPDGRAVWAEGVVEGTIARSRRGHHGFGYDPIFEVTELGGKTLAELESGEKHVVSHRGRSLRALADKLRTHSST